MSRFSKAKLIDPAAFHAEANKLSFESKELCRSPRGNAINLYEWGNGELKILIWSQMHGNEPTGTFALWDLMTELSEGLFDEIKSKVSLLMIPILNPDGTQAYSRFNAQGIDLNRDARSRSTVEMKAFFNLIKERRPDWAFNLHDQRNIFNVKSSPRSATLALLSPSFNEERALNETREDVMKLVASILPNLKAEAKGHISRFTDEFYPRATGDILQSMSIRTLLVESGAFPNDPLRNKARKLNHILMSEALYQISSGTYRDADISEYEKIPENDKNLFDLLIRNVVINEVVCDIGFLLKEKLTKKNELETSLVVSEIGDLKDCFGHLESDFRGELLEGEFIREKKVLSDHPLFLKVLQNG